MTLPEWKAHCRAGRAVVRFTDAKLDDFMFDVYDNSLWNGLTPEGLKAWLTEHKSEILEWMRLGGHLPGLEAHFLFPVNPRAEVVPGAIPGFLHHGLIVASGPPKAAKKTLFLLAMTAKIHSGQDFLDMPLRRRRCGWVQLDMAEADFQVYSERIARGMTVPDMPEDPMPYFFERMDLKIEKDRLNLIEGIQRCEIQLLVIDSARGVASVKMKESDEVAPMLRDFFCHQLRDQLGIDVVVVTHVPKGGTTPIGSVDWAAAADSLLEFSPLEGQGGPHHQPDHAAARSGPVRITVGGRHADSILTFELVAPSEDKLIIAKVTAQEMEQKTVSKPTRIGAAYRALQAAGDSGLTLNALYVAVKEAGEGFRKNHLRQFVEALQIQHPNVCTKKGKKDSLIVYIEK